MSLRTLGALSLVLAVAAACAPVSPPGERRPSYQQWQADVESAMSGVEEYLDDSAGDDSAIVLDIDNTALETEYHPGEPNEPVLAAARHAEELGMVVLIVTARKHSQRDESLTELERAGYSPDDICLRGYDVAKSRGKAQCREAFTDEGYTITANVGNRDTDFEGGYFDRAFRLPHYDGQLS